MLTNVHVHALNVTGKTRSVEFLVNGKDDFAVSLAEQHRFYEILGTDPSRKKALTLEGGHVPQDMRGLVRAVLDWYDQYLGVVR